MPPGPPAKKGGIPKIAIIIGCIIVGLGLLIGGIVLIASLVTGNSADKDFYEIGVDKIPSVKNILGEIRDISGVSSSTSGGVTTKTYTYDVPENQNEDMQKYADALINKHDFYSTSAHDYSGSSGKGFELTRLSDEEGYIVVLTIDYDSNGYEITLVRAKGTLEIPEPEIGLAPESTPDPTPDPTVAPEEIPEPEETPESPPIELEQGEIPGEGGTVRANAATIFTFTPDEDGVWIFNTSENGDSDPMLTMLNPDGEIIAQNDDGMGDYNAIVYDLLHAGMQYSIILSFYDDLPGSASVTAKLADVIPAGGGDIEVAAPQIYSFIPDRSGTWEFRTSDNGESDPFLELYDSDINKIGEDDDSGEDYNAFMTVELEAGQTYYLVAEFYGYGPVTYKLSITRK